MHRTTGETNDCPLASVQMCWSTTRHLGVCDAVVVGLVLLALIRSTQTLAGEPGPSPAEPVKPAFHAPLPIMTPLPIVPVSPFAFPVPATFQAVEPAAPAAYPSGEFRPHGRSLLEKNAPPAVVDDAPMLRGTTVWQRLSEYRSRDRVRVVTLWETGRGNVSLQAGKKGDPSLQWTSRLMNRGGATRGLLDPWVTSSLAGVARGLHLTGHAAGTDSIGRAAKSLDSGNEAGSK